MSAWIAAILKAIGISLIKDFFQALYNGIKKAISDYQEKRQRKKDEETARKIENETDGNVIRSDVDDLP